MNISGFTTDNTVSTGPVAQLDFVRHGKIGLTFHVNDKRGSIGLSIAGFETRHIYYMKPTKKQEAGNLAFYENYVEKFSKKEEFDAITFNS